MIKGEKEFWIDIFMPEWTSISYCRKLDWERWV